MYFVIIMLCLPLTKCLRDNLFDKRANDFFNLIFPAETFFSFFPTRYNLQLIAISSIEIAKLMAQELPSRPPSPPSTLPTPHACFSVVLWLKMGGLPQNMHAVFCHKSVLLRCFLCVWMSFFFFFNKSYQ